RADDWSRPTFQALVAELLRRFLGRLCARVAPQSRRQIYPVSRQGTHPRTGPASSDQAGGFGGPRPVPWRGELRIGAYRAPRSAENGYRPAVVSLCGVVDGPLRSAGVPGVGNLVRETAQSRAGSLCNDGSGAAGAGLPF